MENTYELRPTRLYVDLKAIEYNLNRIKEKLSKDTEIMAVIKAGGYGNGSVEILETLIKSNINIVAVAITEEGVYLRKEGCKLPIVILNQPDELDISKIIEFDLICAVSIVEFAKKLNFEAEQKNKTTKIHIEVDTGAGRIGIKHNEVIDFIGELTRFKNIEIEGIFTHFSCADSDCYYTLKQIEIFEKVLEELQKSNIDIKYKHACNSAGIINYPQAHYNLVRPGIMLYGYYPDESIKHKIDLKPANILKSRITFLKEVDINTPISYNKTFVTSRKSKIATVPIGYADGLKRVLSNRGCVVINSKRAPIIGNICMDMFMVDVSDIDDVNLGDDVYIFDNNIVTVEEIARLCNTINYEIISTLGYRVPRVYI